MIFELILGGEINSRVTLPYAVFVNWQLEMSITSFFIAQL
jgi:hypothetical protein